MYYRAHEVHIEELNVTKYSLLQAGLLQQPPPFPENTTYRLTGGTLTAVIVNAID